MRALGFVAQSSGVFHAKALVDFFRRLLLLGLVETFVSIPVWRSRERLEVRVWLRFEVGVFV